MSTPVAITFDNPAPDACPTTFAAAVALLRTLISGQINVSFSPYVVSATTPTVDEQGYIWFKTDSAGRPLEVRKFYSGAWRRFYAGLQGEARMFLGIPDTFFDNTGKGLAGTDWDGWAICNGNNGTVNLSNLFPVLANLDGGGGIDAHAVSGWQTRVDGSAQHVGGHADITLDASNTYFPARPQIKVWKWSADGNAGRTGGNLYGTESTPGVSANLQEADAGNTSPDAISIVPPFFACALCVWIGYS